MMSLLSHSACQTRLRVIAVIAVALPKTYKTQATYTTQMVCQLACNAFVNNSRAVPISLTSQTKKGVHGCCWLAAGW